MFYKECLPYYNIKDILYVNIEGPEFDLDFSYFNYKDCKEMYEILKKPCLFYQKMLILTRELTRKFLNFSAQITKYKILICKIFKKVKHPQNLRI